MRLNEFLQKVSEYSNGTYVFGNCEIRFKTTLTHPKYSVFNTKTRESHFFDTTSDLLNFSINGIPIRDWIQQLRWRVDVLKTAENALGSAKGSSISLVERWAQDEFPCTVLSPAPETVQEKKGDVVYAEPEEYFPEKIRKQFE